MNEKCSFFNLHGSKIVHLSKSMLFVAPSCVPKILIYPCYSCLYDKCGDYEGRCRTMNGMPQYQLQYFFWLVSIWTVILDTYRNSVVELAENKSTQLS